MIPKVSIVLPVYNGEKTLSLCLDSLMSLDFPKENLEIIVVDNNSTDSTRDIIQRYPVVYAFEPIRGRSAARNRGIRESSGEFIAFVDADCVADRKWLSKILRGFTNEAVAGCGGKLLPYNPQTLIDKYCAFREIFTQGEALYRKELSLPFISTGNAIYCRKSIVKVGLFDDPFFANEGVDLSWRLILAGYQLNFVPEAIVYHTSPKNLIRLVINYFEKGYTFCYIALKYNKLLKYSFMHNFLLLSLFYIPMQFAKFFFLSLNVKKHAVEKISPLLDIVFKIAAFSGLICAFYRLKLDKKVIPPLPIKINKPILVIVNNEASIIDVGNYLYYTVNKLNEVATKILLLLTAKKRIDEVVNIIANEYHADSHEVENDVIDFIEKLKAEGLM